MKIIHISDLHLGKSVNGYNLLKEGDGPKIEGVEKK